LYRKISYLLFLLAIIIFLSTGSHNINTDEAILIAQSEIYPYSEEELSKFNGENNQPSYVAIDNIIYDISDLKDLDDRLMDNSLAGKDISEIIENDTIKEVIIEEAPEVGILQE
jgi:predicted heme/steroid binding protein